MAIRTMQQILEHEQVAFPGVTEGGLVYALIQTHFSCPICHGLGVMRKDGGVPPAKQLGRYRGIHAASGNIVASLIASGLVTCTCRHRLEEWINVYSRHVLRQQALEVAEPTTAPATITIAK